MSEMVCFRRKKGEKIVSVRVTPANSDLLRMVQVIKREVSQ